MNPHPVLETPRLLLRPLTGEQWEELLLRRPVAEVMEHLGIVDKIVFDRHRLRAANGGFSTHNRKLLIFHLLDKDTERLIGWCGYHTWYIEHDRAEIGYGLDDERYKRKGLMSEALAAILAYGFDSMRLHRVEAMTATYNEASKRTLHKFGFTYEGTLREHYLVDGKHEDSLLYGLLSDTWKTR